MSKLVANAGVDPDLVPTRGDGWQAIGRFALMFNGYAVYGFAECARLANKRCAMSMSELRAALFFEQRRWRHFGDTPDDETMEYIGMLLDAIRAIAAVNRSGAAD